MPPQAVLVLVLTIILPLLWLASEFSSSRPLRISLGIRALLMSFDVAFVVGSLQQRNDNAWYGTQASV